MFGLRKTWLDPGPGIAMVQAHYTCSPTGAAPDWADAEQVVLAPQGGPLRTAILEVPRTVEGKTDYSLHHLFFVVTGTDRAASPVFTEDIVSAEVTYEDPDGTDTSVGVVWSAVEPTPELAVPSYSSTVMDGLPFEAMGDTPGEGSLYEFVRAQPLPHVFRGKVWGVRGTRIRYGYHLISNGRPDPADDAERWDDNNGTGWIVEL
jgi:hypothetical protein